MAIAVLNAYKCIGTDAANEYELTTKRFAFLNIDATTINTVNYAVPIPSDAGEDNVFSYEVLLRWKLGNTFGGYVQNIKLWYSSSPPAASVWVMMGTTHTAYTPSDNESSVAVATASDNYYNSSNYLVLPTLGCDTLITAGDGTGYCVMQIKVAYGATAVVPQMLFNLSYEEVS